MNSQLSKTAPSLIRDRLVKPTDRFIHNYPYSKANELLTDHRNHVYELSITPPDSLGERVRSRPTRGGSCFIDETCKSTCQAIYHIALSTIPYSSYKDTVYVSGW